MKHPEISVIIPVYNTGMILQETIDSVLNQSFTDFELIIVDDGSIDQETLNVLNAQSDCRIRVITQKNSGVAHARNRGIEESRGNYIAFLDHDDLFMPEKLAESVKIFRKYKNAVTVYSDIIPFGDMLERRIELKIPDDQVFDRLLAQNWIYSMSCVMVRKAVIEKFEIRFDESCVPCDDWDFHLQCVLRGEFHRASSPLTAYRFYRGNQSMDVMKMYNAGIRTIHKYLRILHEVAVLSGCPRWCLLRAAFFALSEHHYGIAFQLLGKKLFLPAAFHLLKAFFYRPHSAKIFSFVFRKLKKRLSGK